MKPVALDEEVLERIDQLGADDRVRDLLQQLAPEQAGAVRARVIDEESYSEIAQRLSCSESVVRKRVSRGLAQLRHITVDGERAPR